MTTETSESVRRPVRQTADVRAVATWNPAVAGHWELLADWCRRNCGKVASVDVPPELLIAVANRLQELGAVR